MKSYADQIREYIPGTFRVLGTDGFGRSDSRERLRRFFEVDRYFITVAALSALADDNVIESRLVGEAIKKFEIDPEKPDPSIS
jgi:pyruvate dehydrogenase E1 component